MSGFFSCLSGKEKCEKNKEAIISIYLIKEKVEKK